MKINRTKNAVRNMVAGGMLKVTGMLLPLLMRSIILYYLGIEYLGLGGLFTSILSILSLAELGVGHAMVFSMYRPIVEDDTDTICALLRLYRRYYRIIGLFIAGLGIALTPFLRHLVKGDVPAGINLYILYYMNLAATVLTYWLFAYKKSLLDAHQQVGTASIITLIVNIAQFAAQFVVLAILRDYYIFLLVQIISQIANNILIAIRVRKLYPKYVPQGSLPTQVTQDINRRIRDFFTSKLSAVIFNSADPVVISAFMGLVTLAIYQNYFYIISALRSMIEVFIVACIAGIGNSLVTEDEEKNYQDLKRLTTLYGWVLCVCTSMLICMYQPFIKIWMGEESLLGFKYVICFTVYFYSMGINKLINMFKDAAGIWHKDRFRPLTAALVNLGLNLATVNRFGLYGVLLSSVVSIVLVQIPWLLYNLFQEIYPERYRKRYSAGLGVLTVITLAACTLSCMLCRYLAFDGWMALLVNAGISFIIPNLFCLIVYGRDPLLRKSVRQLLAVVRSH